MKARWMLAGLVLLLCGINALNVVNSYVGSPTGWWVSPHHFGIDQGPVVLMIENYRSGLLWNIMRRCKPIVTGLRRAGFSGGWL
jgi:hypothetical protein